MQRTPDGRMRHTCRALVGNRAIEGFHSRRHVLSVRHFLKKREDHDRFVIFSTSNIVEKNRHDTDAENSPLAYFSAFKGTTGRPGTSSVKSTGPLVYRLAHQRGWQDADAQDLAQKVLVKVAQSIARFQPNEQQARFRTWLTAICRHTLIDELRLRHREGPLDTEPSCPAADVSVEQLELEQRRQIFRWAAGKSAGSVRRIHVGGILVDRRGPTACGRSRPPNWGLSVGCRLHRPEPSDAVSQTTSPGV